MDFGITGGPAGALIDTAADFARNEIEPHVAKFEREERFPRELIVKMGEVGLLGGTIPEQYGGLGLDYLTLHAPARGARLRRRHGRGHRRMAELLTRQADPPVRHRRAEAAIPHSALPGKDIRRPCRHRAAFRD